MADININTSSEQIDELLSRSVDTIYPSKEALKELLTSGKQISAYVGIDPTADYVHIGHATNYLILERLHRLGHKIIVLVGDFTAMIGDPSDKTSARVQLTKEQVLKNLQSFKDQIGKILDFQNTKNPIEFRFNSEWLGTLTFEKLVELASQFTVQQMLERDMFQRRIGENKPLYVHEFLYPPLQGYDSVALNIDLEVGGTDQTFNMLAGRTLVKRYQNREKFVISTTLLENPVTGEKLMSKSFGTGIALNESPLGMFGKVMALADEAIIQVFIDCTRISLGEVENKKQRLEAGENPKQLKLELAEEIVSTYHNKEYAKQAKENWEKTFSEKQIPENIQEIKVTSGSKLLDVLVENGLSASKTQTRRLFEDGAVRNLENNEKITDFEMVIERPLILKVGKKTFIKFVV